MADGELERLTKALKKMPIAAMITNLEDRRILAINDRAAELFGEPPDDLVGVDSASRVVPEEQAAVERAYDAIATRAIDSYQARRRVVLPDASERAIAVWGRRIDTPDGAYGLWIVTSDVETRSFESHDAHPPDVVLALTDHDWRLAYVNVDAQLLGASGEELVGEPLLGFVHPSVAGEFLEAASRAVADMMAVTFRTRLRAGPDRWAERYAMLVPMCDHNPPRLGVVVTPGPLGEEVPPEDALEPHMRRSAVEARAAQALRALPKLAGHPASAGLSARQVEIVSRLIDGENVERIATSLFLSQSTVRNHLTAIYRKFGVHSQAELLAALLRAGRGDEP
jgi:PAS domain S-box-containing protein